MSTGTTTREQLRRRATVRPQALLDAVRSLDAQPTAEAFAEIMGWIRSEYDARGGGALIGLFGRCYLGPPYVDHLMTVAGAICEHYTLEEQVPAPYGSARGLASSPAYAYVEVYADGAIVPVRMDGTPVV